MNIQSEDLKRPTVTTGPLPASKKQYISPSDAPDLDVPVREIQLSEHADEPNVIVYDPSGPYTDESADINVETGLQRNREAWIFERGGIERTTGREVKPADNGNVEGAHHVERLAIGALAESQVLAAQF